MSRPEDDSTDTRLDRALGHLLRGGVLLAAAVVLLGGISYLADLLEMFPNDLSRALAAYNAGEGAVQRHGGIPPYEETATYVKRALTVYYGRPYGAVATASINGGRKLKGGFKTAAMQPIAEMPGMRYLGSQ